VAADELAVRAIETRIRDNITDMDAGWTAAANVAWSGAAFVPPEDDGWMRPTVLFADTEYGTMGVQGTGQNVVVGVLRTSFFVRPGVGLGNLRGYTTAYRALFDRASLSLTGHGPAKFGPAGAPRLGPDETGWEHYVLDCPFTVEEWGA
jgi:hypothetical protein